MVAWGVFGFRLRGFEARFHGCEAGLEQKSRNSRDLNIQSSQPNPKSSNPSLQISNPSPRTSNPNPSTDIRRYGVLKTTGSSQGSSAGCFLLYFTVYLGSSNKIFTFHGSPGPFRAGLRGSESGVRRSGAGVRGFLPSRCPDHVNYKVCGPADAQSM